MGARSLARFRRYRREFLVPFDLVHHAGFYLEDAAERALLFDFHRGRSAQPFDRLETARMHVVARFLHARIAARWHPAPQVPAAPAPAARLSEREAQIAEAVAAGLSNKMIASDLGISVRTVENHMRSIFFKLAVRSRTQLAARLHLHSAATRQ
jgi:DNA-binding NarL/FixJ family response regulator